MIDAFARIRNKLFHHVLFNMELEIVIQLCGSRKNSTDQYSSPDTVDSCKGLHFLFSPIVRQAT